MTKSDDSWSGKPRKITELERGDHHHLTEGDECYFVGEYTPRAGFAHSATNQLISNLKKKPSTRGTFQWKYKVQAIGDAAAALASSLNPASLGSCVFVPIPPSKLPDDAEYDDRMAKVCRAIHPTANVLELVTLAQARDAAHENDDTRDPDALRAKLRLAVSMLETLPPIVFLVDDMLTTGCSFRACKDLILEHAPESRVIGFFISRRVPTSGFEAINIDDW
ncbi:MULTISPECIES: phosphoribosyltransferase [unclassified Sphingobium]|uniref:phosphoribosyltransferase n=1 Tax=unclassified Sphingobium TaxID=2611147 RepID=UPI0005CBB0C1|nr:MULTISPECIES: phosphoribosyltransferase [unclassified Sphingobium]AJR26919.1 hypothetical protein TZ53_24290 [Sphingobium sp. YBL2]QPI75417.1 phosphoribosyltransferase [Sphingobium sp. Cam5-1]UZW58077.1 phosphoribosyltransferase [Sphingobium sp. JS3065]